MSIAFTRPVPKSAAPARATAGETSSDRMLVGRFAGGDRLAMQRLFARHRTVIYRWLLRLVGDESQAEDLLSDVFLDVWRQAGLFDARSSVCRLGYWRLRVSRRSRHADAGRMR